LGRGRPALSFPGSWPLSWLLQAAWGGAGLALGGVEAGAEGPAVGRPDGGSGGVPSAAPGPPHSSLLRGLRAAAGRGELSA